MSSMERIKKIELSPEKQKEREAEKAAEREAETKWEARCVERSPVPPEALRGLEGIREADRILKELKVIGILIGGLAKRMALEGIFDEQELAKHKDVDVLIPSIYKDCKYHPKQWENGIDWWITHSDDETPTNGATNLVCAPTFDFDIAKTAEYFGNPEKAYGLWICPPEALEFMEEVEREELGKIKGSFKTKSVEEIDLPRRPTERLETLQERAEELGLRFFSENKSNRSYGLIKFQSPSKQIGGEYNYTYSSLKRHSYRREDFGRKDFAADKKSKHCKPI